MLSSHAFKYLVRGVEVASATGSIPYRWDSKAQRVVYVTSWQRTFIYYFHNTIYCAYLAFCWVRWIQVAFFWESPTSPMAMASLYVAAMYNIVTAIQWSIFSNYGQHQIWLNSFLGLVKEFKGRSGEGDKGTFECYRTCRTYMISGCTVFCLDTLSCFALPKAPFFITSLLPDPMGMTWLELLPFVSIHIYIWIHQWATFFTFTNWILCYLTGVKNILSELQCNPSKASREHSSLNLRPKQSPTSFAREFHRLQHTQGYYNQLWCSSNALFEVVCLTGTTLAYYGGVKLDGARAVQQGVVALFITIFLVKIWETMGHTYEISSEVLHSWRRVARGNVWFRKYLKSVKPIRVHVGNFFYADRGIKLTILSIILNNTLTLLLSTNN